MEKKKKSTSKIASRAMVGLPLLVLHKDDLILLTIKAKRATEPQLPQRIDRRGCGSTSRKIQGSAADGSH